MNKKIAFIGSGNMAEAMIKSLNTENILCVDIDKDRLEFLQKKYGVKIDGNLEDYDVFILAVKPNNAQEAIESLKIKSSSLIISIMAGVKIEKIAALSGREQIVRVMPNTPALFAKGAIGYSFSKQVDAQNREFAKNILQAIGEAIEVSEDDLDAVTALSGSGPAYVFYLAEAMIEAGISLGLNENVAKKLAIQTIYGAGFMLANSVDEPTVLRQKVTSKGGTTQAAIEYLEEKKLKEIVKVALEKAKTRSIELSK